MTVHGRHEEAMRLAQRALMHRQRGEVDAAHAHTLAALHAEEQALGLLRPGLEPTWGRLCLSAASLALQAGHIRAAVNHARNGLRYQPQDAYICAGLEGVLYDAVMQTDETPGATQRHHLPDHSCDCYIADKEHLRLLRIPRALASQRRWLTVIDIGHPHLTILCAQAALMVRDLLHMLMDQLVLAGAVLPVSMSQDLAAAMIHATSPGYRWYVVLTSDYPHVPSTMESVVLPGPRQCRLAGHRILRTEWPSRLPVPLPRRSLYPTYDAAVNAAVLCGLFAQQAGASPGGTSTMFLEV